MVEMKRLFSLIIYGNQAQQNHISNSTTIGYGEFERCLAEIAHSTLQVAHSQTEKLKIFLMHIRNACKTNYQITNFVLDRKVRTNHSQSRQQNSQDKYNSMPLQMENKKVDSHIGLALKALKNNGAAMNADLGGVCDNNDEFASSQQFKQSRFTDTGPKISHLDENQYDTLAQSTYSGCQTTRQIYRQNQNSFGEFQAYPPQQINSARDFNQTMQTNHQPQGQRQQTQGNDNDHELKEFLQLEQQVLKQNQKQHTVHFEYSESGEQNETGDFTRLAETNNSQSSVHAQQPYKQPPVPQPPTRQRQSNQYISSQTRMNGDQKQRVKPTNVSDGSLKLNGISSQQQSHHQSTQSQTQVSDMQRSSFGGGGANGSAVIKIQELEKQFSSSTASTTNVNQERMSRAEKRESSVEQINAKIKDLLDSKHQDFLSPGSQQQRKQSAKKRFNQTAAAQVHSSRRLVSPGSNTSQDVKVSQIDLAAGNNKNIISPPSQKLEQKPFGFRAQNREAPVLKNMKQQHQNQELFEESYGKDELLQKLKATNQKLAESQRTGSVNSSMTHNSAYGQTGSNNNSSTYQMYKNTPGNQNKENATPGAPTGNSGQSSYMGCYSQRTLATSPANNSERALVMNQSANNISQNTGPPTFEGKKQVNIGEDMTKEISSEKLYIQNLLQELGKAKEEVGKLKQERDEFKQFKVSIQSVTTPAQQSKLLQSCMQTLGRKQKQLAFKHWQSKMEIEKRNEKLIVNIGFHLNRAAVVYKDQTLQKWKLATQQDRQTQIEDGLTSQFSRILFINKIAHSFIQRDADKLGIIRAFGIWKDQIKQENLEKLQREQRAEREVVGEIRVKMDQERAEYDWQRERADEIERRIQGATSLINDFIARHD